MKMSKKELCALLADMQQSVEQDDSFEGSVQYLTSDDQEKPFEVTAAYRIGNSRGQGGMRIINSDHAVQS